MTTTPTLTTATTTTTTTYDAGPEAPARAVHAGARTRLVLCVLVVVVALGWVAVRGLTGSFVYYLTPSDVLVAHKADVGQRVRLGGLVVGGSVHRAAGGALRFAVTDGHRSMRVVSTGDVPELFRARQGVVLEGALGADHRFHADTLLVKHDGRYRAPDLKANR